MQDLGERMPAWLREHSELRAETSGQDDDSIAYVTGLCIDTQHMFNEGVQVSIASLNIYRVYNKCSSEEKKLIVNVRLKGTSEDP